MSLSKNEKLLSDIARTTEEIFSLEQLRERLNTKKRLVIKFGADVTAPFLHLGHAVNLWIMRRFQEDGHKVIFLVGDFTTRIGDPTGRGDTRSKIDRDDIDKNSKLFIEQIKSILITDDPELFEVRKNSDWFDKMSVDKFISLLSLTTHARLISRDMFQKRIKEDNDIYTHELIYPILQGYDSYELESDLTIVGSDQLFNEMMGKFYQEKFGQKPQTIITSKITPGLTGGPKQSKSLNNYVSIIDTPRDKYGKIMGLKDDLIVDWMKVYTQMPMEEIEIQRKALENNLNPIESKHVLAQSIVERYHGRESAQEEYEWFLKTFSKKDFPAEAPVVEVNEKQINLFELIKTLKNDSSNSEIRTLISQNAISINGEKVADGKKIINIPQDQFLEIKIGKRVFFKVKSKD
ncbi:MAG: tyrosine--tRNA ligase [Oligoflexia bacterium]|nr:tyrosine--tRNA ligase [Oligoflexia bacterium]MBF0365027.1 tyrosine--tRNA ligase [Oligoflexia bacterium]